MYKLCAFDLDGTLINTIGDISNSLNYGLSTFGCPAHDEHEYLQMVGEGIKVLCTKALPEDKKNLATELTQIYASHYINHCCEKSKPYHGVVDLLKKLVAVGIKCAIVSNKPHVQTLKVVEKYLRDIPFSYVLGQQDKIPRKPAPDMLNLAMQECDASQNETIYIGDSNVDVVFAHSVGIRCIGVEWGFRGKRELVEAGADLIVDSADVIFEAVTSFVTV